jgi:hypothetical protein
MFCKLLLFHFILCMLCTGELAQDAESASVCSSEAGYESDDGEHC